jgi:hypothetical protein
MRTNAKRPGHRGDGRAAQNDQIVEPIDPKNSREAVIRQAVTWYVANRYVAERPLVPNLSRRFGLTTREAVQALSIAGRAA